MALQDYLDQEIKKVCPIYGISFGKLDDKSTWIIQYEEKATEEQKAEAIKILNGFVWNEEKQKEQNDNLKIEKYRNDLAIKVGFIEYKKANPNAKFIDYIYFLENMEV